MFNFLTCDAFTCSLHSSTRNNVADWNWTTAWPERKLDGGVAQKLLHIQGLLHREAFTLRSFCTQTSRSLIDRSCYTKKSLHRGLFTHRRVCTQKLLHRGEAFTQRSFYTQKHLHTASFYTHRGFYTEKSLHKGAFYTQKVLHREVFTLRSFCTQTSRSLIDRSC